MRLVDHNRYDAPREEVRPFFGIMARNITIKTAGWGYYVVENVEGLGPDYSWWRPTYGSAQHKQAQLIGRAIVERGYVIDVGEPCGP